MELSEEKIRCYTRRLLLSRMRLLNSHGFYGLLLMRLRFSLSHTVTETACTDGVFITFHPDFLEGLSDRELDFVLMHEVLHVVLRHCLRTGDRQPERFNIACDIVVNSLILQECKGDKQSITLNQWGESMHIAPNGKEGSEYTAEQVYEMLPPMKGSSINGSGSKEPGNSAHTWDDHTRWGSRDEEENLEELWLKQLDETCEALRVRDPSDSRGLIPLFAKRILDQLKQPQTDWRAILNAFIQQEINDYSFSPPDRRFQDSPFFLPDFNEWGDCDKVSDILFMIDTSGSISDDMMTAAYSEVKGAIDQFDGNLKGWLGFFDAAIIQPIPFENVEEFLAIRPAGGGGTDFHIIFQYVKQFMSDEPPACIIILTDGYAPFPKEEEALGIPVLWLLNNDRITPPWGKLARITV